MQGLKRHLPRLDPRFRPGQRRSRLLRAPLRDWKFSAPIEQMIPSGMKIYASLCGWSLARAHARSGDGRAASTAHI
jgi:hypothetical protein